MEITPAQKELINQIRKQPKFGNVEEEVPINNIYEYMKPAVYATGKARGTGIRGR